MGSKSAVLLLAAATLLSSCFFGAINGEIRPMLLTREDRMTLAASEAGRVDVLNFRDGQRGIYHLQFITMRPASLFLPVLLHADMLLYVHRGTGRISYFNEEERDSTQHIDLDRGDVYRIGKDNVFYVQSSQESASEDLCLHAVFNIENAESTKELPLAVYSSITELVRHFDVMVLQKSFGASEQTVRDIISVDSPQMIVNFRQLMNWVETQKPEGKFFGSMRGIRMAAAANGDILNMKNKKKQQHYKKTAFNFYKVKPDVENCNGWSTALSDKDLKHFKETDFAAFMVNLTRGAMVGPHWNPSSKEIDIVVDGRGVVQVGCSCREWSTEMEGVGVRCKEETFMAEEGDVVVVPEYSPAAQISYNNGSLVFIGLSSFAGQSRPRFLAGKKSLLQNIDAEILARAFGARMSTVAEFSSSQGQETLLECTSCAEELARKIMEKPQEEEEGTEVEEEEEKEQRKRRKEERRKKRGERKRKEGGRRKQLQREGRRREEGKKEEHRRREREEVQVQVGERVPDAHGSMMSSTLPWRIKPVRIKKHQISSFPS